MRKHHFPPAASFISHRSSPCLAPAFPARPLHASASLLLGRLPCPRRLCRRGMGWNGAPCEWSVQSGGRMQCRAGPLSSGLQGPAQLSAAAQPTHLGIEWGRCIKKPGESFFGPGRVRRAFRLIPSPSSHMAPLLPTSTSSPSVSVFGGSSLPLFSVRLSIDKTGARKWCCEEEWDEKVM